MAGRKKAPASTPVSPVLQGLVDQVPVTPALMDRLIERINNQTVIRAAAQSDVTQEVALLAALLHLRERESLLTALVEDLEQALPGDKRTYRALRRRVDEALPDPDPETQADGLEPDLTSAEAADFESWLFMQSNVMHLQPVPLMLRSWRADEEWRNRTHEKPYRSKA
ncbi:hypothetical protein [Leisingera caerulea]|uniref:hypothetical protein n=1 Tax=Leisingera caerulea TaxID=506591 RepID=UPI0003F528F5|nr:hypothetical protein [Leisingera caerulea]